MKPRLVFAMGVGTTSPSTSLEVVMPSHNGEGITIKANSSSGTGSQPGLLFLNSADSATGNIRSNASKDLIFLSNGDSDERMRILAGGNVGIGTNSPQHKLEVNGNIRCQSGYKILLGSVEIKSGSGAPSGGDGAPQGSLYLRTDGGASTTLYVKTGPTIWTAK